jgi:hypothetical protein
MRKLDVFGRGLSRRAYAATLAGAESCFGRVKEMLSKCRLDRPAWKSGLHKNSRAKTISYFAFSS